MEFVSGGWEGEGVCNELGGGRSGRGRLDVGTRLKGEAMTGSYRSVVGISLALFPVKKSQKSQKKWCAS